MTKQWWYVTALETKQVTRAFVAVDRADALAQMTEWVREETAAGRHVHGPFVVELPIGD